MNLSMGMNESCGSELKQCEPYMDTIIGNLKRKKQRAQEQLNTATAALEALEKNPELATVLELIAKA